MSDVWPAMVSTLLVSQPSPADVVKYSDSPRKVLWQGDKEIT